MQSLDVITVAATKTEETRDRRAGAGQRGDAGADPGAAAEPAGRHLRHDVPGVSFQDRGDDPSTAINIRGLQDFGRVAVVVDGARQNYQRSGHNANGSFFLDPELIGGVDVVRGPTANIYGSGAIGGVVSFRTKDINDVLRPGERWGVDMTGSYGTNNGRGLGSVFGGVRVDPTVDVFGGAVYRTQGNYKDGDGTEIGNTGNDIAAGLIKLTVRPADGHEVKFGGMFQDYQYNVGQFNRGPVLTAAQRRAVSGLLGLCLRRQELHRHAELEIFASRTTCCSTGTSTLYGNRTDNDQTKTYHNCDQRRGLLRRRQCRQQHLRLRRRQARLSCSTPSASTSTTPRASMLGDWRNAVTYGVDAFQDDVTTFDQRGNSNITTPSGKRTVSGGFVQLKNNYSTWLEVDQRAALRPLRAEFGDRSRPSGERLSPKITIGVTPVAGFTPYVSYAEGYRAPSITETLIAGAHATGGGPALFACPDGTTGLFCFLPNAALRPEVGKNKEVGLNLKYDDVFTAGRQLPRQDQRVPQRRRRLHRPGRLDAAVPVPAGFGRYSQYYQYQNIAARPDRRLRGRDDLRRGAVVRRRRRPPCSAARTPQTGVGLATRAAAQDHHHRRRAAARPQADDLGAVVVRSRANTDLPAGYLPSTAYDLVNLYLAYQRDRGHHAELLDRQSAEPVLSAVCDPRRPRPTAPRRTTCCSAAPVPASSTRAASRFILEEHRSTLDPFDDAPRAALMPQRGFERHATQLKPRQAAISQERQMFIAMNRFQVKTGSERPSRRSGRTRESYLGEHAGLRRISSAEGAAGRRPHAVFDPHHLGRQGRVRSLDHVGTVPPLACPRRQRHRPEPLSRPSEVRGFRGASAPNASPARRPERRMRASMRWRRYAEHRPRRPQDAIWPTIPAR